MMCNDCDIMWKCIRNDNMSGKFGFHPNLEAKYWKNLASSSSALMEMHHHRISALYVAKH